MAFEIQEINGKLYKITTIPIDKYNTRKVHSPLTESEYEKIVGSIRNSHNAEINTLEKFKGSKMPKALEVDERDIRAPEPVRGTPIEMKSKTQVVEGDTPPKAKKYRVGG